MHALEAFAGTNLAVGRGQPGAGVEGDERGARGRLGAPDVDGDGRAAAVVERAGGGATGLDEGSGADDLKPLG